MRPIQGRWGGRHSIVGASPYAGLFDPVGGGGCGECPINVGSRPYAGVFDPFRVFLWASFLLVMKEKNEINIIYLVFSVNCTNFDPKLRSKIGCISEKPK